MGSGYSIHASSNALNFFFFWSAEGIFMNVLVLSAARPLKPKPKLKLKLSAIQTTEKPLIYDPYTFSHYSLC